MVESSICIYIYTSHLEREGHSNLANKCVFIDFEKEASFNLFMKPPLLKLLEKVCFIKAEQDLWTT